MRSQRNSDVLKYQSLLPVDNYTIVWFFRAPRWYIGPTAMPRAAVTPIAIGCDSHPRHSRSRRDVMRLSNKRSPYLFGVATANRTKVTTPNKYGTEIIARMSDWENCRRDDIPAWRPNKITLLSLLPLDLTMYHRFISFLRAVQSHEGC